MNGIFEKAKCPFVPKERFNVKFYDEEHLPKKADPNKDIINKVMNDIQTWAGLDFIKNKWFEKMIIIKDVGFNKIYVIGVSDNFHCEIIRVLKNS